MKGRLKGISPRRWANSLFTNPSPTHTCSCVYSSEFTRCSGQLLPHRTPKPSPEPSARSLAALDPRVKDRHDEHDQAQACGDEVLQCAKT